MPRLQDIISDQAKRKNLIADCCKVLDEEVDAKGGLSGLAVKAAYLTVVERDKFHRDTSSRRILES